MSAEREGEGERVCMFGPDSDSVCVRSELQLPTAGQKLLAAKAEGFLSPSLSLLDFSSFFFPSSDLAYTA